MLEGGLWDFHLAVPGVGALVSQLHRLATAFFAHVHSHQVVAGREPLVAARPLPLAVAAVVIDDLPPVQAHHRASVQQKPSVCSLCVQLRITLRYRHTSSKKRYVQIVNKDLKPRALLTSPCVCAEHWRSRFEPLTHSLRQAAVIGCSGELVVALLRDSNLGSAPAKTRLFR